MPDCFKIRLRVATKMPDRQCKSCNRMELGYEQHCCARFGLGDPTGTVTFNLRFPGQYYDAGTGHFYNHNRYYNPELGRYMEPDPERGIAKHCFARVQDEAIAKWVRGCIKFF